ncbi:MAG: hypothetical protein AB1758_25610 [Candidatus Eremiobacterota bacterium]
MLTRILALLLLPCLLVGCGGVAGKVNGSKKFKSEWTVQLIPLTGSKRNLTATLWVNGDRFRIHKTETGKLMPMDATVYVLESDLVYDGKTLWEFNRKLYPQGQPDQAEQEGTCKHEPSKDELAGMQFWKFPDGLPVEAEGSESVGGVSCTKYISRQRSALGTDLVFRFWVDEGRGVMMKRAVGTGTDSGGGGDAVFGSTFTCDKLEMNPSFDSKDFEHTPSGEAQPIEELPFKAL